MATRLLRHAGKDLGTLRAALERGETVAGFPLAGVTLGGRIALTQEQRTGRNVLGRLGEKSPRLTPPIMVGASLMPAGPGTARDASIAAEDAASGVAGLIEVAQHLSRLHGEDGLEARRDILFAVWGGEPGTIGAAHFVKAPTRAAAARTAAYLHLDMIGRLGARMALQGTGSSADWAREIERANAPVALPVVTEGGGFLPGASTVFFQSEVPVLNAFTGADGRLLYSGVAKVARLMANITLSAARRGTAPAYVRNDPRTTEPRHRFLLAALPPAERETLVAPMPRPTRQATVELAALPAQPLVSIPSEPAAQAATPIKAETPPVEAAAVEVSIPTRSSEPAAPPTASVPTPHPPLLVNPPTAEGIEETPPASAPVEAAAPPEIPKPAPVEVAAVEEPTPILPAELVAPRTPLLVNPPTVEVIEETPPASSPMEAAAPPESPKPAPVEVATVEEPTPILPAEAIEEMPPASPATEAAAPPEIPKPAPVEVAAVEEPAPVLPTKPVAPRPPLLVNSTTTNVIEETPPANAPVEAAAPPEISKPAPVEVAAVEEPTPVRPAEPVPPPLLAASVPAKMPKPATPVVAAPMMKETPPPIQVAAAEKTPPPPARKPEAAAAAKSVDAARDKAPANGPLEIARVAPSASLQGPPVAAALVAPLLPALGQSGRLGKPLASASGNGGGSCVRKNRGAVVFCIEAIDWPADMEGPFDTSTLMYRGAKAIVRYDGGTATGFHTLFHAQDFDAVVGHFEGLLGKPSATPERRIAPMAKPRQANPTRVWRIAGGAVLEVRQFDDARGGFPDIKHGVVLLGRTPVRAIFPQLSSLDLMMIR